MVQLEFVCGISLKIFFFFFLRETATSPWVPFRANFRPLGRLFHDYFALVAPSLLDPERNDPYVSAMLIAGNTITTNYAVGTPKNHLTDRDGTFDSNDKNMLKIWSIA